MKLTRKQGRKIAQSGNIAAIVAAAQGDYDNALVAATPGGIEAQERAGRDKLVATFLFLPIDGMSKYKDILLSWGFAIGDAIDELFVAITPPEGWILRATEHAMWSEIVDPAGVVRGGVFFKAAFYDRKAAFSLRTRYRIDSEFTNGNIWWHVTDQKTGDVLFDRPVVASTDFAASDAAEQECRDWLNKTYPLWTAIEAYWGG
jgi:hypothetical protein